jgi:type I restriction enzyme, S subunit
MIEWKNKPIGTLGKVITGKTPPKDDSQYFEHGDRLFVSPKDLDDGRLYVNQTQTQITDKALLKFKNQVLRRNAVMFTSLSFGFGKMGIASEDCLTNQQINSIIVNENNHYRFVFYLLKVYKPIIFSYNSGIDTPIVPKSVFEKIEVKVPALPLQQKIAAILSAYDDLIESNKRRIALLEKIAEEIYREWFVRMRFPGHEQVAFHKGIPEGWEVKELQDTDISIIDGDRGKNYPQKSEFESEGYCLFLNTGNIKNNKFNFETTEFITQRKDESLRKGKLKPQDVVLTTRGTIGNIAYYRQNSSFKHVRINSGMVVLRLNQQEDLSIYYYYLFKSDLLKSQYQLFSSGSAQPQLPIKDMKKINIVIPSNDILKEFCLLIGPIDQQIELIGQGISNLQQTRDRLLPRLISGKLAVEDLDIQFPPSMTNPSEFQPDRS